MIAICPNPFRDSELKYTRQAAEMLHAAGYETAVCPVFAEDAPQMIPEDIKATTLDTVRSRCSLVVVIGGDGTILSAARQLHNADIPILGVNLGSKGFMAALEPEHMQLIVKAAAGEYTVSRRMMLDIELERGGEIIYRDKALNDVVLHGYGDCIRLTAWCAGDRITSFSGDGIILSTPTGSTGYSMSAGGPIVEPEASAIIVSPICAHMMSARSYVLSASHDVSVLAEKLHGRRAYISVDGNSAMDLTNGDLLRVRRSERCILMADMGLKSFFDLAFEKLT